MPLTDAHIRNAKPQEKPQKLADGGGLFLMVTPQGSKLWRLAYRFAGKQKTLAVGAYPAISLEKAREARGATKKLLAEGTDPADARRVEKHKQKLASENTFQTIADEWLQKLRREGRAVRTLAKTEWLLAFANPVIGRRPIAAISSAEVLEVLRRVENRGRHETARRLRSTIGSVFRYGISTARAENDPTVALRGALVTPKVQHRAAVTDPKALGGLLRAIDGFDGQPTTRAALQLQSILFPRPGELRAAEWKEFDFDKAIWTIPAERTKMRREHRVSLPDQALAILHALQPITGSGALLFPSIRSTRRPISENTLNAAMRRLGYSKDEVTAHGFRATASTLLNESGLWASDVIERQLAHVESNDVRRAYARGDHWADRVRMMQWWADYLDELKVVGTVIPLRGKRAI
ncbi:MAG: integrase arm-type DNA-binding domain-containing protein [Alphaproteobacteria bacterium]|nr:integrase arm-type DNA-binding domain-containing protein [Alphaproteobacteria bacterium]MBU0795810.1 integrase arm-type DNA-binding domain-containing protein [Alphaproteobacteria bacterium]MBU0886672.1 integrase arm-type DNA-binding domain-containing protein [Alphaproteobacteria bacterium]MBU1814527.1 integrase arm-type DNA-binding domain-containing protein [Alphaproteobacteria bacterium]